MLYLAYIVLFCYAEMTLMCDSELHIHSIVKVVTYILEDFKSSNDC